MKIGSLFSGYGGLDMGVQSVLGGEVAWHVEFDAAPSSILAHHWPDVPNYGDITKVDFSQVEPVDIITGGFPCQDLSLAGRRAGMRPGTRSGLWAEYLRAIATLRPRLAVIENVRGLLSGCAESEADSDLGSCPRCAGDTSARHAPNVRALGRVLIDLARIGYDAKWIGVRASDAGATHERFRVIVAAYPEGQPWGLRNGDDVRAGSGTLGLTPPAGGSSLAKPTRERGSEGWPESEGIEGRPHDVVSSSYAPDPDGIRRERTDSGPQAGSPTTSFDPSTWGVYAPAVERWEQIIGRSAPAAVRVNPAAYERWRARIRKRRDGRDRRPIGHRGSLHGPGLTLNPQFVEWMMGLPAGHVTGVGLTRLEELKALGNGVVPQQVALAVSLMTSIK